MSDLKPSRPEQAFSSPEAPSEGRLNTNVRHLMDYEAKILSYTPSETEADFDSSALIAFGRTLMNWLPSFDETFSEARAIAAAYDQKFIKIFGERWTRSTAWGQADARIAEMILGAAAITEMHRTESVSRNKAALSQYNAVVRDVIRANPDMAEAELISLLHKGLDWANLPQAYRGQAEAELKKIVNGASGEIVAEQLLEWAASEGLLTFKRASVEDDLSGVDFIITLPSGETLRIDIKRNDEQVQKTGIADHTTPSFNIVSNQQDPDDIRVELYTGAGDVLAKSQLRLNQEDIAPKAAALLQTLQRIAEIVTTRKQEELERLLAQYAMEFKGL